MKKKVQEEKLKKAEERRSRLIESSSLEGINTSVEEQAKNQLLQTFEGIPQGI